MNEKVLTVDLRLEVDYYYPNGIRGWLYIDNFYGDDFSDLMDIEECGILYRERGTAESANREYATECDGSMTQIALQWQYYEQGDYLLLTPFVRDDNRTYYGNTIEYQLL